MIVKEDFLNKLRQYFNLNLYEVKIWTALLSRGVSTAGELSEISDVPRSRAYDVLESLEKKGFIVMKLGKPINYVAVEPAEVVERAKKLAKNEAEDCVKKLESLKGTELLNELTTLHKTGIEFIEPADLSGAIRGRHNIYMHLDSVLKNAKNSVSLVTTAKGLGRKLEALKPTLESLSKKGVKVRVAAPVTKESAGAVKSLLNFADVRNSGKLDARFCIVDGKELVFMLMNDNDVHQSYDIGVWINTPFFSSALNNMFELAWKDMESGEKALKKL